MKVARDLAPTALALDFGAPRMSPELVVPAP
jgi:hypothetical protein